MLLTPLTEIYWQDTGCFASWPLKYRSDIYSEGENFHNCVCIGVNGTKPPAGAVHSSQNSQSHAQSLQHSKWPTRYDAKVSFRSIIVPLVLLNPGDRRPPHAGCFIRDLSKPLDFSSDKFQSAHFRYRPVTNLTRSMTQLLAIKPLAEWSSDPEFTCWGDFIGWMHESDVMSLDISLAVINDNRLPDSSKIQTNYLVIGLFVQVVVSFKKGNYKHHLMNRTATRGFIYFHIKLTKTTIRSEISINKINAPLLTHCGLVTS